MRYRTIKIRDKKNQENAICDLCGCNDAFMYDAFIYSNLKKECIYVVTLCNPCVHSMKDACVELINDNNDDKSGKVAIIEGFDDNGEPIFRFNEYDGNKSVRELYEKITK